MRLIEKATQEEEKKYRIQREKDQEEKKKHLKLFRPNLENPANKEQTMMLNQQESQRTEKYKEFIDDI